MSTGGTEPTGTVAAYDSLAEQYDQGLGYRSHQSAARMRRVIVGLLQPAAGGRLALELGAGTGWMLDVTAPLFQELHAIEPSAGMLRVCQRRIAAAGLHTVRAYAGDAMALEGIAPASVDAVYAVGVLDAVSEPARVFAESHRVLKPGGLLVVATANGQCPWHGMRDRIIGTHAARTGRYFTPRELVDVAQAAGLRVVELSTWGAAPQGLASVPAVMCFDACERMVKTVGLSRYLAVLTASFRKPS